MKRISMMEIMSKKYGKLSVLREANISEKWRRNMLCQCDCGKQITVSLSNLRQGHTISCGCYLRDWIKLNKTTHNLRKHPLYRIWAGMKSRCNNPRASHFQHYGGRGIKVCDSWFNNFELFFSWAIENGYEEGREIDRIDNNGNYEPNNCRFVTHQINCQNRLRRVI